MTRNDFLLGAGFVGVCLAGSVIVIATETNGSTAAAWAQAVGTIAAVVAAGSIASRQSREAAAAAAEQRREQEERDRKATYLLVMRLASLLSDIEIRLVTGAQGVARLPNAQALITQDIDSVLDAMLFNVSWDEQMVARFELLPTVGAQTVAHLLYAVNRFDRQTTKLMRFTAKHGGRWNELVQKLQSNFENMRIDLNKTKAALAPLLDDPPADVKSNPHGDG